MPTAVPFALDAQFVPFVENLTVYTNSSAPVEVIIAGLGATDVLAQAVFTAKITDSDADSASTTIQKIIASTLSPAGQITALGSGAYLLTFPLSSADQQLLLTQHKYNVQIWVNVAGALPAADPVVQTGTIAALQNLSGVTGILAPAGRIDLTPNPASVSIGHTTALTATVYDPSGAVMVGRTCNWSSSAPSVVSVDQNGVVTGVSAGTAVITATTGGVSDTTTVTSAAALDGSTADGIATMGALLTSGWSLESASRLVFDGSGNIQEVKDIRGGTFPSLFGNAGGGATLPPWDPVTGSSSTTGTQNFRTIESLLYDLSKDQVLILIAKLAPAANSWAAAIQKLDFTVRADIYSPDGSSLELAMLNFAQVVPAFGLTNSAQTRAYILTAGAAQGVGTTLGNIFRAAEIRGRLRNVNNTFLALDPSGACAVVIGGVQTGAGGGFTFIAQPITLFDAYVLNAPATRSIMAFVDRRLAFQKGSPIPSQPSLVCAGDSRFYGFNLPNPVTDSAPGQIQAALPGWDVSNRGVPSRSVADVYTLRDRLINADGRPGRDVWLYLWIGTNVIPGVTGAQMGAQIATIATEAFANGYSKVFVQTESPSLADPVRTDYNNYILGLETAGTITKAIRADLIPEYLLLGNPAWYLDGLHPTKALNTKIRDRFRLDAGI